ncbi:MAG: hypothetical protein HQL44_05035 [Alphaproteobacteria bacterium]|nr:hypothetical protein [Alphaproteobacteria bacterium]
MTVLLSRSARPPKSGFDRWCAIAGAPGPAALHPAMKALDLAQKLEGAYDAAVEEWWSLAQALGQEASSVLAHTPACAANISDFGLMLAWTRLVDEWAAGPETVLVICDDPWLFRHLAQRQGVNRIASAPPLLLAETLLKLRGLLARLAASRRFASWARKLQAHSQKCPKERPALLVYAHPSSNAEGYDAYFGKLMTDVPDLVRLIHVDGTPDKVAPLCSDGRSFSLHGFGDPAFARRLWKFQWQPVITDNWLVRRAAVLEGSTAQSVAIAWQIHCVVAWMDKAKPKTIAWPWENHSWERAMVRAAKARRVRTIGYQHATVGWREWNYAPHSNPDGSASLPDSILAVGPSDLARLMRYGCPRHILSVGGALRFPKLPTPRQDTTAPVFVALPFDADISVQMLDAIRPLAADGYRFLVKDHPMNPFQIEPRPGIEPTGQRLSDIDAVSGVLYCLTTVGLEAVLAGLPTLRFIPQGKVPVDVMPDGVKIPAADANSLKRELAQLAAPPAIDAQQVFAQADPEFWVKALSA